MKLAPLPAYLVYDGFDGDIDAACLLERILKDKFALLECSENLKQFLWVCQSNQNSGDNKPYIAGNSFSNAALLCPPPPFFPPQHFQY